MDKNAISPSKKGRLLTNRFNIVIGIFLATLNVGFVVTSFGVFFKPVSADFGWTRAETSGAFSLATFISGVMGIIAGRLGDRFDARIVISICGFIAGLSYLLLSGMNSLWQLYFYYGILVGTGLASVVPCSSLVTRWYKRRRGMMTGLAMCGAAFSSIFSPYVATWLISRYNWHVSYLMIGGLCLVFIITGTFYMFRAGKESTEPEERTSHVENKSQVSGKSFQEAIRSWPFWCLALIYFSFHYAINVIVVHAVPHGTDMGISPVLAASVLMIANGANVIGAFGLGSINDRIGSWRSLVIGMSVVVVGLTIFLLAHNYWSLCLFAVIFGVAWGGTGSMRSVMVAELFGLKSHGVLVGAILLFALVGGTIGPLLSGYIFDVTGKYQIAFILMLGLCLAGLILTSLLPHRSHKS